MHGLTQRVPMFDHTMVPGDLVQPGRTMPGNRSALEAELAEARRHWRAIHDPQLRAACRVVAYARWRTAITRLADFATTYYQQQTDRERIDERA